MSGVGGGGGGGGEETDRQTDNGCVYVFVPLLSWYRGVYPMYIVVCEAKGAFSFGRIRGIQTNTLA